MVDGDRVRIEIGFEGGQVIGGFVAAPNADELERALHEDGPRVIVLETEGWPDVDAATKAAFAELLGQLKAAGVTLIRRTDHSFVEALEKAIASGRAVCGSITSWENRWYQRGMLDAATDLPDRDAVGEVVAHVERF